MSETVLISGVFDPLHAGHLAYVNAAKAYGPVVAAVTDDPDRHVPLVPVNDRATLLLGLGVEAVYTQPVTGETIRALRPRYFVKGSDWDGRLPEDILEACGETGTQVIYTETVTRSSSKLLADYTRATNAQKLVAFERFVQGQRPAEKPWEPVTDYSFEARKEIEWPHAQIIKDTFQHKDRIPPTVLDAGCGPGHLVRMLLAIGMNARGFDLSIDKHYTERPFANGDLVQFYDWYVDEFRSDLVLCREVLEHLTVPQIAVAVRNLVKLSSRFVYVTTRFTAKAHFLDVDSADSLDPTHISMLNQDLLRTLFVLEGCTRRADLEAKLDHRKLGRVLVYEVPA
jgi:glycerol-3-phosphate cytidylyltransferase-like family protein/SAM-dependent methyltransferase